MTNEATAGETTAGRASGDFRAADGALWRFWVDRGGTFTDVIGRSPEGQIHTRKLLSENPRRYADATLAGIEAILADVGCHMSPERIAEVRIGTTVATNALLERRGQATALVTSAGFADALEIAYQNRPDVFALHIQRPKMLYARVIEARERLDACGEIVQALDTSRLESELREIHASGIDSLAVCLLHAYRNPVHENRIADLAAEVGFRQISLSHRVSGMNRFVARGQTTVVHAYLTPVLQRYIELVQAALPGVALLLMQSDGGLAGAATIHGHQAILSGPAGGLVGAANAAHGAGYSKLVSFDMGGTSTDVAHYAGSVERCLERELAGVHLRAPMLDIHTVAAGGSSVLQLHAGKFSIGPRSAGANPGPACYGLGGPLTITDCNLVLGRIRADCFPHCVGEHGDRPLDESACRTGFAALREQLLTDTGVDRSIEDIAEGCREIAVANMAAAVKRISTERGFDLADHVLVAFGGAGPQHACDVADALGITSVLVHPLAGVLSAYGIGNAKRRARRQCSLDVVVDANTAAALNAHLVELTAQCEAELSRHPASSSKLEQEIQVEVRFRGSDTGLLLPLYPDETLAQRHCEQHRQRFGFSPEGGVARIKSLLVELCVVPEPGRISVSDRPRADRIRGEQSDQARLYSAGRWLNTGVYWRDAVPAARQLSGPALIIEPHSSIVVEPGWRARCLQDGQLLLERIKPLATVRRDPTRPDPVALELFNNLFMSVAEQMGAALQHTAHSVNIKERLDFSCGVFDPDGGLVANAPHMPVHLGSMGDTVRAVVSGFGADMGPDDAVVTNDPYQGGTHLPDITVVSPVFARQKPVFFVASRGHHADLGGITPGSMPAHSQRIDEEGVLIAPRLLLRQGKFLHREMRRLLTKGPYAVRNVEQNIADLKAQLAANAMGRRALATAISEHGLESVLAYTAHVRDNAAQQVRAVMRHLHDGEFSYDMDCGARIRVSVRVERTLHRLCVDFSGSSGQLANNFNAPAAIARAAVLYVFRCMVSQAIPMNAGCLQDIDIVIPPHSMLQPVPPAAVVAGNVETSQVLVDALFGALGVLAGSQGTMNNLTFGNARFQYYETIAGGGGAGNGFDGASGVQTHMTNSRLTDPEILENRFPVRVEAFSLRSGSGGNGLYRGGNGVCRSLRFLESMSLAMLAGNRVHRPFGLAGGTPGAAGVNTLIHSDGERISLPACFQCEVDAGDLLCVETPGGGGYGTPPTPLCKSAEN